MLAVSERCVECLQYLKEGVLNAWSVLKKVC